MDEDERDGAYAARFTILELMVAWLLSEMIKPYSGAKPEEVVERLRTILWEAVPNLGTRPENQQMAFRREWDRRMDYLFDWVTQLLGSSEGNPMDGS
jgi:hypothetical protein